jgi:L-aminopeptidase/D-esterase-like protein
MTHDAHLRTPAGRPRARALGIPFDGAPGAYNATTDVPGTASRRVAHGSDAYTVGVFVQANFGSRRRTPGRPHERVVELIAARGLR